MSGISTLCIFSLIYFFLFLSLFTQQKLYYLVTYVYSSHTYKGMFAYSHLPSSTYLNIYLLYNFSNLAILYISSWLLHISLVSELRKYVFFTILHVIISTLSQKQRIFPRNTSECIWEQVPWPVNFSLRKFPRNPEKKKKFKLASLDPLTF